MKDEKEVDIQKLGKSISGKVIAWVLPPFSCLEMFMLERDVRRRYEDTSLTFRERLGPMHGTRFGVELAVTCGHR